MVTIRVPYSKREEHIWSKLAVGMLAVAMVATASALLRQNRPPEIPRSEADDLKDVEQLYAAGL